MNLTPADAPEDLVSVRVDIPDSVKIERLESSSLLSDWRMRPATLEVQAIGDRWLATGSTAVLAVPSILIPPPEINFLINPGHSDFNSLQFQEPVDFRFDPRMWKG